MFVPQQNEKNRHVGTSKSLVKKSFGGAPDCTKLVSRFKKSPGGGGGGGGGAGAGACTRTQGAFSAFVASPLICREKHFLASNSPVCRCYCYTLGVTEHTVCGY